MEAYEISARLEAAAASKIKIYPCNNLRASNIGHPCERYLYLLIKHWDKQAPHDVGLQNIFDLGNTIEEYTISKIKEAGYEVITPVERSWKVENPLITGREDIRIKEENGELIPAEIKGLSPYEWDRLNTVEDFYASKKHYVRAYPSQLLVYMWKFEKEHGFFFLTNKLTGAIKPIRVPFDWDRADQLLKKGERVYAALKSDVPPMACDDITVCEECKLAHLCTASINRVEADFDDGELETLILRKQELAPFEREYKEVSDRIKDAMGERQKVIAGQFLVQVSTIEKKSYTVAAQTQRRINITRL